MAGTGKWSRWNELPVTKSPRIIHLAVGHEGLHAVLVTEDGAVFFMGTARRGEDGDQSASSENYKFREINFFIQVKQEGNQNL